jgi:hypothetical protein
MVDVDERVGEGRPPEATENHRMQRRKEREQGTGLLERFGRVSRGIISRQRAEPALNQLTKRA